MHKANQTSYKQGHTPWSKKYDICTIAGCGNKHEARGYCVKHYKRFMKTGSAFTLSLRDERPAVFNGNEARIPLGVGGKGGYALVSQQDWWVSKYKWHKTKSGYAAARINGKLIMMHRLLLNEPDTDCIDHINRNKLDNRRTNLRATTFSVNARNTGVRNTNTSGYTGVSFSKAASKWAAYINVGGKRLHLGLYSTAEEANAAYIKAKNTYL